jgi:copper homeostasis protein CutC
MPTSPSPRRLLEIIATSTGDALAAERGGADRLEICADIEEDGLTPPAELVAAIKDAVSIPVRAMLRPADSFTLAVEERGRVIEEAAALAAAGADGFVVGYLDAAGDPDLETMAELSAGFGRPWTYHRAIDHSRDPIATLEALVALTALGCDTVLAGGSAAGVEEGLPVLRRLAEMQAAPGWQGPMLMVGGGLEQARVAELAAHGVGRFHIGEGVRAGDAWSEPVEAERVAAWRELLDAQPAAV